MKILKINAEEIEETEKGPVALVRVSDKSNYGVWKKSTSPATSVFKHLPEYVIQYVPCPHGDLKVPLCDTYPEPLGDKESWTKVVVEGKQNLSGLFGYFKEY